MQFQGEKSLLFRDSLSTSRLPHQATFSAFLNSFWGKYIDFYRGMRKTPGCNSEGKAALPQQLEAPTPHSLLWEYIFFYF